MKTNLVSKAHHILPFVVIGLLSISYFLSLMQVPFHPDESTQIYMSSDFEKLFNSPRDLVWEKTAVIDRQMQLRMLDAPLTRYMIGLARWITGEKAIPVDWDWTHTFESNRKAGAVPTNKLLLTARLSVSFVFPFSLFLLWQVLKKNFNSPAAWIGIFAAAGNALILLHTRRAMAESLTFFMLICLIFLMFQKKPSPVILGLVSALVFNAKQSTVTWILVAFASILFGSTNAAGTIKRKLNNLFLCAGTFIFIILLLNPFTWKNPYSSLQSALIMRQELVSRQYADISRVSPSAALSTPLQRVSALTANLFFTPPAVVDTANYIDDLKVSITRYNANPLNKLFRAFPGGFFLLVFSLFGIYVIFRFPAQAKFRESVILLMGGIAQFLFLAGTVPLPFQRYVVPLVPIALFFFAIGTGKLVELSCQRINLWKQNRSNLD